MLDNMFWANVETKRQKRKKTLIHQVADDAI